MLVVRALLKLVFVATVCFFYVSSMNDDNDWSGRVASRPPHRQLAQLCGLRCTANTTLFSYRKATYSYTTYSIEHSACMCTTYLFESPITQMIVSTSDRVSRQRSVLVAGPRAESRGAERALSGGIVPCALPSAHSHRRL